MGYIVGWWGCCRIFVSWIIGISRVMGELRLMGVRKGRGRRVFDVEEGTIVYCILLFFYGCYGVINV